MQAPLLLFILVMSLSCIVWVLIVGQWYVNLTVILCWLSWFFVARSFFVACIYAPNRNPDRHEFFVGCVNAFDPAIPIFLCGDFLD